MASILHVAVGMLGGRLVAGGPRWRPLAALAGLSMLPDADVLAFRLGIPYHHPLGHRGATHSLAFAVGMGIIAAIWAQLAHRPAARWGLAVTLVVATHPLLDALTDGGLGVALWWPLRADRVFAPWRPLPVAPIGWGMLSPRGLWVVAAEALPSALLVALALRRAPVPPDRAAR